MDTRADRIAGILKRAEGNRLRVSEIVEELEELEGVESLKTTVSPTVRQDNHVRRNKGLTPRFRIFGDGTEEWGYISLKEPPTGAEDLSPDYAQVVEIIERAEKKAREALTDAIGRMGWQEFESKFLMRILVALGFNQVEITSHSGDGGIDAVCQYNRGIVSSTALVSAKHWGQRSGGVGPDEVQRLRGISHEADTGIIITSSKFTRGAKEEADGGANQRVIVLIDGDLIVEACLTNGMGVQEVSLPPLYEFVDFDKDKTT